jgi:hypothetical protein
VVCRIVRGRGGIGRRAGFRYQWRESWGFESLRPHHPHEYGLTRRLNAFEMILASLLN